MAAVEAAPAVVKSDLFEGVLRLGDSALILGQQLSEWISRGPTVELDIAVQNQALDLIGQARFLLDYAGRVEGRGRDEDALAYFREPHEFRNCLLVEQPNGDFAQTMLRQFLYAVYADLVFEAMQGSSDAEMAAIAGKAHKEMAYHVRHCGEWVVRLGDGTEESHDRAAAGLDALWPYVHDMFAADAIDERLAVAGIMPDVSALKPQWLESVSQVFSRATLAIRDDDWAPAGGRQGNHGERLSYIVGEMQVVARSDPEARW
jgi:ring-1,2-phenylacetyl-CoA epoxidase subunit PaaC